jgi:hypothetical protein
LHGSEMSPMWAFTSPVVQRRTTTGESSRLSSDGGFVRRHPELSESACLRGHVARKKRKSFCPSCARYHSAAVRLSRAHRGCFRWERTYRHSVRGPVSTSASTTGNVRLKTGDGSTAVAEDAFRRAASWHTSS